mmetsp:Transcript_57350/g.117390  ORF Transcript_57350/g.117390 Transcript_57350/m.117390 type:complete len:124 (-) Transcript_57350:134-505(-)
MGSLSVQRRMVPSHAEVHGEYHTASSAQEPPLAQPCTGKSAQTSAYGEPRSLDCSPTRLLCREQSALDRNDFFTVEAGGPGKNGPQGKCSASGGSWEVGGCSPERTLMHEFPSSPLDEHWLLH